MKDSIRLFVAATLPPALQEALQQQLQPYQHPAIRFIPAQNLHLTLYFIGNVPAAQLASIKQTIRQAAQQHRPFILEMAQAGPGPKRKFPRLVWARFAPHEAFEKLSRNLAQALAPEPQQQKSIPHITLARFRKGDPAPRDLPLVIPEEPLRLAVEAIALWQSELASPHPVYTVLETYPLG